MMMNMASSGLIQEVSQEFESVNESAAQLPLAKKVSATKPRLNKNSQSPVRYPAIGNKKNYTAYEGRHLKVTEPNKNPYGVPHKIKRPINATLLCTLPPNGAVKARPMNIEEVILSGNYRKRLDPSELDMQTDN